MSWLTTDLRRPANGPIYRGYGSGHFGIDYTAGDGNVYAADFGRVVVSKCNNSTGYGGEIVVSHGFGRYTRYAHVRQRFVNVGTFVTRGQKIAIIGGIPGEPCAGNTTGRHLHFEVLIDPKSSTNYYGAQYTRNPLPYLQGFPNPNVRTRRIVTIAGTIGIIGIAAYYLLKRRLA
jgi:murein DD-endopeptidase MepM/ murein hydrolase activator NlpD